MSKNTIEAIEATVVTFCEGDTLPTVTQDDLAAVSEFIARNHANMRNERYFLSNKDGREALATLATMACSRPMLAKTMGAMFAKGLTPFAMIKDVREVRVCFRSDKDGEKYDASKGDASKGERVFLMRSTLATA